MKNLRSLGEPSSSAHLRRTGRDLVDFRTTFSCHTGPGDIHVINISRLGLMARTKAVVSKGERLIILLPFCCDVEAMVRWTESSSIGPAFITPANVDEYAHM